MSFCLRSPKPPAPAASFSALRRRSGLSRLGGRLVHNLLHGVLCAAISMQMLTGCARSTQPEPVVQWDLSPEAQRTYATLLLDQSIRNDDRQGVLEASQLLLTLEHRAQPFIDAAAWLILNKDNAEAQALLLQVTKRIPDDLSLHLLLAETWFEQGENDKALSVLRTFQRAYPKSDLARQELGILYVKTGYHKEADALFSALPQRLRSPFVRYAHAQALAGLKQTQRAIHQLRLAVEESPEFLDAWFDLARLLESSGQHKEAGEIYSSLLDQEPDNQDLWIRMVEGQIRAGNPQKALYYAQKGPDTFGYRLTAVTLFLDARLFREAETLLDEIRKNPDAPDEVNFYLAAIAYEDRKDTRETLELLAAIPSDNRFYDRALRLRIQLLHDQGSMDEALEIIRQGQEHFPADRDFRMMEIHLLLLQDRIQEAHSASIVARNMWPEDTEIAYLYGSILDSLGRKHEAFETMEGIIAKTPDAYQALNYVGYALAEQGRNLERAEALLLKAAQIAPDHAYILDSLAWVYYRQKLLDKAWELVERAVTLPGGDDPAIWEHYGDIALAHGFKDKARLGWEKALELAHPNPETIRKKIQSL